MFQKLLIQDLELNGKKALIRVDFNVPIDESGKVIDDTRIRAALPTIRYVLDNGGSAVLMSHLGRPKGKRVAEYSLAPCAKLLSKLLSKDVLMASDCVGKEAEKLAADLKNGQVLMLENLRYHRAEEHPEEDPYFAEQLSRLGDVYINDAFGTAHRAHASTAEITRYFPDHAAAGLLLQKEAEFLENAMESPDRPFYAIIGGAKISTKIGVLRTLLPKVDGLFIGGAMAYTFMKGENIDIGESLFEEEYLSQAKELLGEKKIHLPVDHVVAKEIDAEAETKIVTNEEGIPKGYRGVDIGPETVKKFSEKLQDGKTVFWNGPLGVFEIEKFAKGTYKIAEVLADLSATTIVGGGDCVSAVNQSGYSDKFTHLSTGGGAAIEYIEKGTLPGIEALSSKKGSKISHS